MPTITVHSTQHDRPFAPSRAMRASASASAPAPVPSGRGLSALPPRFANWELPVRTVVVRDRKDRPLVCTLAAMRPGDAWLFRVSNGFAVSSLRTSIACVNNVRRADGSDRTLSYESRDSEVLVFCNAIAPAEGVPA